MPQPGALLGQCGRRGRGAGGTDAELPQQATHVEHEAVIAIRQPAEQIGSGIERGARTTGHAGVRGEHAGSRGILGFRRFQGNLAGQPGGQPSGHSHLRLTDKGLIEVGRVDQGFEDPLVPEAIGLADQNSELFSSELAPGLSQSEQRVV